MGLNPTSKWACSAFLAQMPLMDRKAQHSFSPSIGGRTEREDNTAEGNEGNNRTKENLHLRTEKEIEGICEINRMAEDNSKQIVPPKYDLNAKWDACIDLTVRRFVYSSLGGAFAGLLFFSQSLLLLFLLIFFWKI